MSDANEIILNGKRYDAHTGRFLGDAVKLTSAHHSTAAAVADPPRRPAHAGPDAAKSKVPAQFDTEGFARVPVRRDPPHRLPIHKPQHSQTLMRQIVKPPTVASSLKRSAHVHPATDQLVIQPKFDIVPKQSVASVDPSRAKRAHAIGRSGLIDHFHPLAKPAAAHHAAPAIAANLSPAAQPVPKAAPTTASSQRSQEIFERALARANSHKQPPFTAASRYKKHSSSKLTVLASSFAIILIVAFIAYQNIGSIQIRLAASRAGINATLPHWQPDGFSIGSFSYKPGLVSVKFSDSSNARTFTVTQMLSNWDSSALLNEYVMPNSENFAPIHTQGSTIYMYGNNNATWVNGGIWYKLTSDGALSTSQLVKVATSM